MDRKRPKDSLLARLARPFASLGRFGRARPPEAKAGKAAADAADSMVDDSFTLALDAMLTEDEARFQTKLQVISLVEFREAVGDKWLRLSEKVMLIAEGVINLHIGAGNVYGRRGQDFFVLLFRNVPYAEGRRRAVIIAQELGTRLVGAQFIGSERPLALAAEISLDDAMAAHGGLDLAAIARAVIEMRAILAPVERSGGYKPHLTSLPDDEDAPLRHSPLPAPLAESGDLRAHLRPSKLAAKDFEPRRAMLPGGASGADKTPETVAAPSWSLVEMGGGKPAAASDPGLGAAPPMPGDAALSLAWRPSWRAEGESIGVYAAQIQRVDSPGQTPFEGVRAYPVGGGESALTLDRYAVGAAAREMRSPDFARSGAVVLLPLHWASMASTQRMSILAPLADLSEETRSTRLILDLFGLPDGLPDAQLAAAIAALAPMCRSVGLRTRLSLPRVTRAKICGAGLSGVDLGELPSEERTDDASLIKALAAMKAEAGDLPVYAFGLRRRAAVAGAARVGFGLINGPGLMKDLPRPAKVLPAPKARLIGAQP